MNVLTYKGFSASIEINVKDKIIFGKIEHINDLVTFESESVQEIESEFHKAVDDYLAFCEAVGKAPEKPYTGTFNVRISPDLHRRAAVSARRQGKSLNAYVEEAISEKTEAQNANLNLNVHIRQNVEIQENNFTAVVQQGQQWGARERFSAVRLLNE